MFNASNKHLITRFLIISSTASETYMAGTSITAVKENPV